VSIEILVQAEREIEGRDPEPGVLPGPVAVLPPVRCVEVGPPAIRQPQRLSGLTVEERFKVLRSELHGPESRREAGGEVQDQRGAVGAVGGQGGVHGAAGVNDE
jgi:hypothetical protein